MQHGTTQFSVHFWIISTQIEKVHSWTVCLNEKKKRKEENTLLFAFSRANAQIPPPLPSWHTLQIQTTLS
jgi:hypothetical protein